MAQGSIRICAATALFALAVLLVLFSSELFASGPLEIDNLAAEYQSAIQPLVKRFCGDCHGAEELVEGEINLTAMKNWEDANKHPQTWQKVAEMLDHGLMPPEEAEQPTVEERALLLKWLREYLTLEARARAGDPGRVILRRLSNQEYTFTLRDLTGVESLDPAREFPSDGAAGEGFTNTGNALVMSPALLTKYLDAAKEVARHAVLLPDGFRFSAHTTARDWTDETLAQIRHLYGEYTDASGGTQVNLQGIVLDTNQGGRLPVEKYLTATIVERDALTAGKKSIEVVASEQGLNAKYLGLLWASLTSAKPSLLLDDLRARWHVAEPKDAPALAADVAAWQKGLWSFSSVGLIGRANGPKRWMEPVIPMTIKQDIKFKIPDSLDSSDVTISLVSKDAGDGNDNDFVVWQEPRLVAPGLPDLLLRDVRSVTRELTSRRTRMFASAAAYLQAADEASAAQGQLDVAALAEKYGVEEGGLRAWLDYLGIGAGGTVELEGIFTNKLTGLGGYEGINGWGNKDTPYLVTNSTAQPMQIPGHVKPHGVVVHPAPTLRVAAGWKSPISTAVSIEGMVVHAHPACGNGVTWALELRRGGIRQRLVSGVAHGAGEAKFGPLEHQIVRAGDVISLLIGPRDGEHSCDLTSIDLKITSEDQDDPQTWNLAEDLSGDVLVANPHADRFGNEGVWHSYSEPDVGGAMGPVIPADSLVAKWQAAKSAEERRTLAHEVQDMLKTGGPAEKNSADAALYRQLASLSGPLFGGLRGNTLLDKGAATAKDLAGGSPTKEAEVGLDPAMFGKHPNGSALDEQSLCVQAPSVVEIRLPADLAAGCELVTTVALDTESGAEGSAQAEVVAGKQNLASGLLRGEAHVTAEAGQSWAKILKVANSAPILVAEGSAAQRRVQAGFEEYRQLFPAALCYTKIVPVDEVISVTLFYREDDQLMRLMLDESQKQRLDRLWQELHFVSRDALTSVDAFTQLLEFASQDADPKVFEPLRQPIHQRAAAFRQQLTDCEPIQLEKLIEFAAQAYRRPLTTGEQSDLHLLYDKLRKEGIPHEDAFRLTLARVLVGPAFLYKVERPIAGAEQGAISDWELANRLSYFLWSSQPDAELWQAAADGTLHEPDVLVAQTRRMLRENKTRRLAVEFACHWLHIDNFENLDEKSERHFPTFIGLREAMAEESIQFFTDLFQNNRSVLDILDADHTFLNELLAQHYGIPGVTGVEWRRVDGVKKFSRGGVLAQATTLAKQSGASRTSPILRGNWISEVLLGEKLPKPPKGVPPLPDDESETEGLTVRQLVEKHVSDPKCAVCHRRIDPYGFSLEAFDAIGRYREKDLGDRPVETRVTAMDGAEFDGLDGLRNYLLTNRRETFVRQFCRKLLGYALGRAVQLSDDPLLTEMQSKLTENDYKVDVAFEMIVRSRQFREIRGMDMAFEE